MFSWFFGRAANRRLIERLHAEIVAAARDPVFFTAYAIADTFEGRFEVLTLHAVLVLRRLRALPAPAPDMAQDLVDTAFRHFEIALRDMGVGDTSVPKRMRVLAEAFLGRGKAYDLALEKGGATLAAALARNIYGGAGNPDRLVRYVEAAEKALAGAAIEVFSQGRVPFPRPATIPPAALSGPG